jgi:hypothetical protein
MKTTQNLAPLIPAMFPLLGSAVAGSLADIEHVVLFMQGEWPASKLRELDTETQ